MILDWRVFFCFSIPMLLWGGWIWARLGYNKGWFVAPLPVISRSGYFTLPTAVLGILVGLVGIFLVEANPNDKNSVYFFYGAIGLWGISYVVAYIEPKWMAPEWYRWLKENYGDIMPYLVLDAHEMGRQVWKERVATQAGLEEWAEEVRRKYRR